MNTSRIVSYLLARLDVWRWRTAMHQRTHQPADDHLPAALVPSVAAGNTQDRVLADIDQFGSCIALDPRDTALFGAPETQVPRHQHQVQVVLVHGEVRVRKRIVPRMGTTFRHRVISRLHLDFFLEAAALIRLRDHPSVPQLRTLDVRQLTLELEYIHGRDIRRELAARDLTTDEPELARRFAALVRGGDPALSAWIPAAAREVLRCGVAPLDMHAGNVIRGTRTGRFYMIDFNFVELRPAPGWDDGARVFAGICALPP